jgi:PAS domain S-box-containing protein
MAKETSIVDPQTVLAGREMTLARLDRLTLENQLLLDTVPVGIVFLRQRTILRCNRRFEQIFGRAPHELDGQSTRVLYPDDAAFEVGGEADRSLAGGRAHEREQLLVRNDGTRFWCRLYGRAMNVARPADGTVWLFEDVSERKAEAELTRQLLDHYQAIFEHAGAGIVFTRDRRCESCNPRFAEMYGYADTHALVGQPTSVLFGSPQDCEQLERFAAPALSCGDQFDVEWEMRRHDGTPLWVHLYAKAIDPGDRRAARSGSRTTSPRATRPSRRCARRCSSRTRSSRTRRPASCS